MKMRKPCIVSELRPNYLLIHGKGNRVNTGSQLSEALQSMFSVCGDAAAKESGVIRRQRIFTASSLARTFVLGLFEKPNASAEELSAMAAQCDAPVTKQAIEKRYTPAMVRFLESRFSDPRGSSCSPRTPSLPF